MSGFGIRLKEARKMRGLTQIELAILCDTDESLIRAYEKERRAPGKNMMLRLFEALKMPADFFFQDELSFNPYRDKDGLFSDIAKLTPAQYTLVKGLVENLKKM